MSGAGGGAGATEEGEEEVEPEPEPVVLEPQRAYVLVDGHASSHLDFVIASLEAAGQRDFPDGHGGVCTPGLKVVKEFRVMLNKVEAKRVLSTSAPAVVKLKERLAEEAIAAAAAAEEAAKEAAKEAKNKKTPRTTPRQEEGKEDGAGAAEEEEEVIQRRVFDPIVRPEEIKSLSSDRATFIILEGLRAVAVVDEVLGPGNPDEWEDFRDCVRAKVGGDDEFNLLHCGVTEEHATEVIEIMEDIHTQHQALSEDSGVRIVKKSQWVNLDDLYKFLFPPGMQHPRSTGRLVVFGEFGPFQADGTLRSGWRGRHVITDRELKVMIDEIEREDLLAIFVKSKGLPEEEKQEVLKGADESKNKLPNMRKEQIDSLFKGLPRNKDGDVSFHAMQQVIVSARKRRMGEMKKMYPDLATGGGGEEPPAIRAPPPAAGRGTKLGRKPGPVKMKKGAVSRKIHDNESFKIVAKILNTDSHHICTIEGVNDPAITQNVRLLRPEPDPKHVGWDDVCCLRETNRPSYVKTHKKL